MAAGSKEALGDYKAKNTIHLFCHFYSLYLVFAAYIYKYISTPSPFKQINKYYVFFFLNKFPKIRFLSLWMEISHIK